MYNGIKQVGNGNHTREKTKCKRLYTNRAARRYCNHSAFVGNTDACSESSKEAGKIVCMQGEHALMGSDLGHVLPGQ
jgi:hypothetical protein